MKAGTTSIVVSGGGYAGVIAALRHAGETKRLDTANTLINGLDTFVERQLLLEQPTWLRVETIDGRPYFTLFCCSEFRQVSHIHVIVGRKLCGLRCQRGGAEAYHGRHWEVMDVP